MLRLMLTLKGGRVTRKKLVDADTGEVIASDGQMIVDLVWSFRQNADPELSIRLKGRHFTIGSDITLEMVHSEQEQAERPGDDQ